MSFADIKDQVPAVRLLCNMITKKRIPNGLLFWGPGGVGKRLTAIQMAKAINCTDPTQDGGACDACLSCRKTENNNHPDVSHVAPVKKSRIIDVETVNWINEMASLRPFESLWRVFIIQEADRMGLPAQNHFLKTLEEPPGNSLFILLTEYPGMLLPTIRSRCQRVRFGTLRPETIVDLLRRNRDLPMDLAESIAAIAQGQMSRALDLVDSDKRDTALDIIGRIADGADPVSLAEEFARYLDAKRGQIKAAIKADGDEPDLNAISKEDKEEQKAQHLALAEALIRRDIMEFLYLFGTWYRDTAVLHVTGDAQRVFNRDQLPRIEKARPLELDKALEAIEKARRYLERFLNEERVFRDLFFALAR